MPDLDIVVMWMCESNEYFETTVTGSTGSEHVVQQNPLTHELECSCKGFQFRKTCNHIKTVVEEKRQCGWFEQIHGGKPVDGVDFDGEPEKKCPRCNGPVRTVRVGI